MLDHRLNKAVLLAGAPGFVGCQIRKRLVDQQAQCV